MSEKRVTLREINEAIAAIALSHGEDCQCTTCLAAHGDPESLEVILNDFRVLRSVRAKP